MSMDEPVIGLPTEPDRAEGDAAAVPVSPAAFRPGSVVQVAYVGPNRRPAFNSEVARVEEAALALELDRLPAGQSPPRPGDDVILVTRRGFDFEAFDAQVLDVAPARGGLLVTPPVEARRPERRAATRVPVAMPLRSGVWLDPTGGEYPIDGASLVDISEGGLQLRALRFVAPGSITRLAFALHPTDRPVLVQAMVAGVTGELRSSAHRLHLQFIEMPEGSREQVARFVKQAAARASRVA